MNRLASGMAVLLATVPALAVETGEIKGQAQIGKTPAARATVMVQGYGMGAQDRFSRDVQTDPEGRFVLRGVPAGKYRVARLTMYRQSTHQGQSETGTGTHGVRVEVAAGGTATVNIGGTGRTVVGKLVAGKGLEARKLAWTAGNFRFLTLDEPNTDGFPGRILVLNVTDDGAVRCEDVPPGRYKLFLSVKDWDGNLDAPDTGQVSRTVVVPPDAAGGGKPHDLGRIEVDAVQRAQ